MKTPRLFGMAFFCVALLGWAQMGSTAKAHRPSSQDVVLAASDGQKVYATYRRTAPQRRGIILLFHQAQANRHEYDPLVPKLNAMGFDTLAIDQRSGDHMFGYPNVTVQRRGGATGYLAAYADLEGALAWAQQKAYKTIITVGSSYSSALNIVLAATHPHRITAAAAFSPGEYVGDDNKIKNAVSRVQIPLYITAEPTATGKQRFNEVLKKAANKANITSYLPQQGVHGASTLRQDRDPTVLKPTSNTLRGFWTARPDLAACLTQEDAAARGQLRHKSLGPRK